MLGPAMTRRYPALAAVFAALLIGALAGGNLIRSTPTATANAGAHTAAGSGRAASDPTASLMLDFTPNAIHTGIYAALSRHYDTANGIRLQVRVPGPAPTRSPC